MRLMGLADDHDTPGLACVSGEDHWDCPVPNDELEVLVAASKHLFFLNIRREGKNDGYVSEDKLRAVVGLDAALVPQCDCMAAQGNQLPH